MVTVAYCTCTIRLYTLSFVAHLNYRTDTLPVSSCNNRAVQTNFEFCFPTCKSINELVNMVKPVSSLVTVLFCCYFVAQLCSFGGVASAIPSSGLSNELLTDFNEVSHLTEPNYWEEAAAQRSMTESGRQGYCCNSNNQQSNNLLGLVSLLGTGLLYLLFFYYVNQNNNNNNNNNGRRRRALRNLSTSGWNSVWDDAGVKEGLFNKMYIFTFACPCILDTSCTKSVLLVSFLTFCF